MRPFEITFGRPGPTWVFVAVITYDQFGDEVGFHGLWQNLMVLSGTTFDAVTVKVDDVDYVVEAEANGEGLVTTSVSSVDDPDADVDPAVQAKAIYAAGVRTQVLNEIFEQPAIAGLSPTGESADVSVEGASSSALLKEFAGNYASAVYESGLAEALDAEEALIPASVEDVTVSISQAASEQYVTLAKSWMALQERTSDGDALSFEDAVEVHTQYAYALRVISLAVEAGKIVAAARSAELGWNDPAVAGMLGQFAPQASCGDTESDLREALEATGSANVDGMISLAAEMRVASPIFGLAQDAVLCAVAEADDDNTLFLQGLAIAGSSEILETLGYDLPSVSEVAPSPIQLRIIARLGEDGRIEHGVELLTGRRILPTYRYIALDSETGSWQTSSEVEVGGLLIGNIQSRRTGDGRTELSFVDSTGETLTPDLRYLAVDIPVGVWLRSGEISAMPDELEQ